TCSHPVVSPPNEACVWREYLSYEVSADRNLNVFLFLLRGAATHPKCWVRHCLWNTKEPKPLDENRRILLDYFDEATSQTLDQTIQNSESHPQEVCPQSSEPVHERPKGSATKSKNAQNLANVS